MDNDFFSLAVDNGIAHLQLNRPERLNTMAPPFFPLLRDAVRGLQKDGDTRVLVISSTGKHFCAGMALDVFGGDDAMLVTTTRARAARVPGDAARADRLLQRDRRGALPGRLRDPGRLRRRRARPGDRLRHPRLHAPTRSSPCRRSTSA